MLRLLPPPPSVAKFVVAALLLSGSLVARDFYEPSPWKPRAILPTSDALGNDFWPPSSKEDVNFNDSAFDTSRLTPAPPPGVFPRVLMTPEDIERVRKKVELGDEAPAAFRVLWEREKRKQSPFYALVVEDEKLGRELAEVLVNRMKALEPKLDKLDARPDRDNLWVAERSIVASGDPDPPTEIWSLIDYDYLHRWMTPEERKLAERLIARITKGRVSNFMVKPDHFLINNHKGFGMEFLRLLMLIEGLEGFDEAVYERASQKARVMLDHYLSRDGMCYESIKGWLNTSVYVALARRHPELLKHSRLRAKIGFFQNALRWQDGRWQIREEMRASAFPFIWMMRFFRPKDLQLDWLYSATFSTHEFLNDPDVRWPDPVGINSELLLLFAEEGLKGRDGKPLDWTSQELIDSRDLPLTWKDDLRGYVITRNSWDKDDLVLGFVCKQDFYYGGHEGSENNRFVLWADGINWVRDSDMLAVKATFLQNMLTIDGKGLHWPPAPGVWLGVTESDGGLIAAGDGKNGYDFSKVMQIHPLDFPSATLPYYAPFAEGNFDLTRDHQIAFHPGTVKWNDGYAHTDYGPWSGETRLVESYRENNPVEKAWRTVYLARGKHPYVLVLDDARKDDKERLYEFNMTIPEGIDLLNNRSPEIVFQQVPPGSGRENDLLLGLASTARDPKTNRPMIENGDPLFLVRTLWRNSPYGFPVPRFERMHVEPQQPFSGLGHVTVPAISDSPEFRILLYPHRQGDPVPETRWNDDRSVLTVKIGEDEDVYRFGKSDGGRTAFSVVRNGTPVIRSELPPARPILEVRGMPFDATDLRTTRLEGSVPQYPFDQSVDVSMLRPPAPAYIVYTLDGTEPNANSPRYAKPIRLDGTARLKARIIDPEWTAGPQESHVLEADFEKVSPADGLARPPAGSHPGLLARVYEMKTVLWDEKGFFDAEKIMLPDLDKQTPVSTSIVDGFVLPFVNPSRPVPEQAKGFYRFNGWFHATERGTYEFAVDSCGPVLMTVGGQDAIDWTGVFHQQQAVRRGTVVLDAGWHALELIVTDPLLWNINTVGEMPFTVSVRRDAGPPAPIAAQSLACVAKDVAMTPAKPEPVRLPAVTPPIGLEPGVDLLTYDRAGKLRDADFLDIDEAEPLRTEKADRMEDNIRPSLVRVYDGWFEAPEEGIYSFDLPARNAEREHLSDLRGAFQNQLRVGDEIVVQRGVAGRRPLGSIHLEAGWHPLSLRLGASSARASVTYPDGQTVPLTAALLRRPSRVAILPAGASREASVHEIYNPTTVSLSKPQELKGTIRYTLDGTEPTKSSPEFRRPITLDRSATVRAAVFLDDGTIAAQNETEIRRVEKPEFGRIASVNFDEWNGRTGESSIENGATLWIAPNSEALEIEGRKTLSVHPTGPSPSARAAVDINVARPVSGAGLKLAGLRMRDNAITVGVRFRSDLVDGQIFGKDGLTAFGKRYRTVGASLSKGRLSGNPGRFSAGAVPSGKWTQVVLTGDADAIRLYINGELAGEAAGSRSLSTDALDFFSNHSALVDEITIYDRVLSPEDIRQWSRTEDQSDRDKHR
ncbi:MAG: chitobiase/beta-hexosaminidase C-terminal domain-containing protein [Terrimicrobiaceae bacterium]|nr:chitobiase/beta-hexosaminidase C-terminal domain-containing protein [Terrimicrobiaceae bacterium]